jgi:hypothetical protein
MRLRRTRVVMKQTTVWADAGAEVGCSLVLGARSLVGPGVPRAPRIATRAHTLDFASADSMPASPKEAWHGGPVSALRRS